MVMTGWCVKHGSEKSSNRHIGDGIDCNGTAQRIGIREI